MSVMSVAPAAPCITKVIKRFDPTSPLMTTSGLWPVGLTCTCPVKSRGFWGGPAPFASRPDTSGLWAAVWEWAAHTHQNLNVSATQMNHRSESAQKEERTMVSRLCSKGGETAEWTLKVCRCVYVSLPPTESLAYLTAPPTWTENKGWFRYPGRSS